jgi:hypothetical protein
MMFGRVCGFALPHDVWQGSIFATGRVFLDLKPGISDAVNLAVDHAGIGWLWVDGISATPFKRI